MPSHAPLSGNFADGDGAAAVSLSVSKLTKRSDFLRMARAKKAVTPGFILQARRRGLNELVTGPRVGFTCSKKVGNAVARNRAKRRLREIARLVLRHEGRDGMDYVLIGRANTTAKRPFNKMLSDLSGALKHVHGTT